MLTKLEIENFKSIYKESIDLGRVNVFIGENGCGKTNILEGLGMLSAAKANKLGNDELALKGIRVTKPSITFGSFLNEKQLEKIKFDAAYLDNGIYKFVWSQVTASDSNDILAEWKDEVLPIHKIDGKRISREEIRERLEEGVGLIRYKIYSLSTRILRGIGGTMLAIPGIHGENLDYLINSFSPKEMDELEHHASMISWLDEIIIDQDDALKFQGHKLNLSQSKLYFRDKFMQKKNNVFSAENANEGILHILFYIALFISDKTPKLFAIDNIETALNPGLCRDLIEVLVKLAKKHDKQVLITTHNPAILDGINLHDDEQRIFTVARNFKGHTKVKRLQIKPDKEVGGHRLKLSELWMRNYLGAIPQNH